MLESVPTVNYSIKKIITQQYKFKHKKNEQQVLLINCCFNKTKSIKNQKKKKWILIKKDAKITKDFLK